MKLILPDGAEFPAKNIGTARVDALIELQLQTGLKAEGLNDRMQASEVFVSAVIHFLTLASCGRAPKWGDVMSMNQTTLGRIEMEPGDPGYEEQQAAKEADAQDPPQEPSGTPDGDDNPPAQD